MRSTPPLRRAGAGPVPDGHGRAATRLSWLAGLLVVTAAHVVVSLDAVAPVQTKDEIGYLAAARWLATGEGGGLLTPEYAGGYAAGWGMLTAPLWWLTSHPPTVYVASVAVDVALSVLVLVPAVAVGRRLGLTAPRAVLLATGLTVAPGRLGYTGYALPEPLLTLQLVVVAWLLLRLPAPEATARRAEGVPGAAGTLLALAGLLAWLPTTHARFAPMAALGLLVLASWSWAARSRAGGAATALGAVGAAAGWWLNGHVERVLYGDVSRTSVAAEQGASLQAGDVLALLVGHAWYGAVAWLGLSLVGFWALARPAGRELRSRRPGARTWLLVGSAAQLATGAAYLSTRLPEGARVDQLVYGRYTDPVWFLLALVGGAALLVRGRPVRLLVAAALSLVALSLGALVALRANAGRVAGFVQLNVPGLEAWGWRVADRFVVPWLPATVLAAAVLALLAAAVLGSGPGSRLRTAAVAVAAGVLLTAALVAEHRNIAPRDSWIRQLFAVRAEVEQQPGAPVVLVVDRPLLLSGNALQWWLADREPTVVEPGRLPAGTPAGALVVAPRAEQPLAGLRLLGTDPSGTYGVWQLEAG